MSFQVPKGLAILAAVAACVVGRAAADSHTSPCQDLHSPECLADVKRLLADEDRYWFGNSYQTTCPPFSFSAGCINSDTQHRSLVTRLKGTNDSSTDTVTQVLNVTFDVPSGSYESCGQTFSVPAVTQTIDPVQRSHISLWSADHQPLVSWRAEPNETYALIVWDAGSFFLHGLFYNITGSDLSHAQTAWNYRGPKNSAERDQPYIFLLYKQTSGIEEDFIRDLLIAVMTQNQNGNFAPKNIVNALVLQGPIAVSVLTVWTDFYSAAFMKENRIINNCPALLTPTFSALPLSYNVSGVFLMSSVDATFTSPEISVSSCCQTATFAENKRIPNPIGNGRISPVYTRLAPSVALVPSNFFDTFYYLQSQYTLLMLDVTDELAGIQNPATFVHWAVVDIREGDLKSGKTILPYRQPLPQAGRGVRTVMFLLLRQSAMVDGLDMSSFTGESCRQVDTNRCRFNLTAFITTLRLTIEGASWFTSSPDVYSRQQIIGDNVLRQPTVCSDVSDYADPCPGAQCTGGSEVTRASLTVVAVVAMLVAQSMMM